MHVSIEELAFDQEALNAISDNPWIFDFGATKHMTDCRKVFASLSNSSSRRVTIADGHGLDVVGVREVNLKSRVGGNFIISNVLYVPKTKKNVPVRWPSGWASSLLRGGEGSTPGSNM
ncbi:hypothetical protein KP509_30G058700 [Ceratopteris richardii]|nr:hypothetical protein KP509_30G058700 [Ceratopteris richardii]